MVDVDEPIGLVRRQRRVALLFVVEDGRQVALVDQLAAAFASVEVLDLVSDLLAVFTLTDVGLELALHGTRGTCMGLAGFRVRLGV